MRPANRDLAPQGVCEDSVVDGETAFLVPVKQPARLVETLAQAIAYP
jgi:hypothetical protein